jgi:hypothetical protein
MRIEMGGGAWEENPLHLIIVEGCGFPGGVVSYRETAARRRELRPREYAGGRP